MKNLAIIVGAGKGKRIGSRDKTFLNLNKKPILAHSVMPFEESHLVSEIILVVRSDKIKKAQEIVKKYRFKKIKGIIPGGKERQDSVYNALKIIDNVDFVLVHDMARPMVTKELVDQCLKTAQKFGCAVPAVLSKDTVKMGVSFVEKNIPREKIWLVQTPQVFRTNILEKAYENAMRKKLYGTDDAFLVEKLGHKIKIVPSFYENIKITVPSDLIIAEEFIKRRKYAY